MRVLFVGNSHTYFNDMPRIFARMCAELGEEEPEVTMLAYSGRSLAWHREEYFALRFALLHGRFDACVIQQQAHPFPGEEPTEDGVREICALCEKAGARPVLFMTWAEKARPENAAVMSRCYRRLAAKEGALLAPVGEIFEALRGSGIELYWRDGEHASPYGSYLTAATLAALLCRTRELDALTDGSFDFRPDYEKGSGRRPTALEELREEEVLLDREQAARIRAAVAAAL
ncbi:MAG: hypothetical protein IK095_10105 [Oscillospiraceae bacterium]|nr:hypothetical protein [Oscillospiraceae bacterium]